MNKTKRRKKVKVKPLPKKWREWEFAVGDEVIHRDYGPARIKLFFFGPIIELQTNEGKEKMSRESGCPLGMPLLVLSRREICPVKIYESLRKRKRTSNDNKSGWSAKEKGKGNEKDFKRG